MKQVARVLSLVVLVALLATPFVSFAQGDPRCSGLSEADCQIVLQAADQMMGVTSFTIPNFEGNFELNMTDSETGELQSVSFYLTGSGAVSFPSVEEALVYLSLTELTVNDGETTETLSDVEVILTPQMAYVKYEGEWYGGEEQTDFSGFDLSSMDFNTMMDTLGVDLSAAITTTRGADAELHGQSMATFTTNVDINQLLTALLSSPMVGEALGMGGEEAMSPEELQMMGAILAPMLTGTTLQTEQWIGQDGYVHKVSLDLVLNLDMTLFVPEAGAITGGLSFDLELDGFNQPINVEIPTEYQSLDDLDTAVPDLGGLGQTLGGGM